MSLHNLISANFFRSIFQYLTTMNGLHFPECAGSTDSPAKQYPSQPCNYSLIFKS